MIYIIDRFVEKHLHVLANVNFIRMLEYSFPEERKKIFLESEHLKLVNEYFDLNSKNLEFYPQNFGKFGNTKFGQLQRVFIRPFRDLLFFWKLFFKKESNKDWFFITHIYPVSLLFVTLFKLLFPQKRVVFAIHGEVEYIFNYKNTYQKFIGCLYKWSFKIPVKKTQYLFLTKVSEDIILEARILKKNNIISIELPTYGNSKIITKSNACDSILRLGHIGSAGMRKNAHYLFGLAEKLSDKIESSQISIGLVGTIEDNMSHYFNNYVKNYVNGQVNVPLDRNIFDEQVQQLDYVLFFYGKEDFILRSSAAFFDAINFEIPIIALRTSFFTDVFTKHGDMGYLCDDINDMKNIIIYLHENNSTSKLIKQYSSFKGSILNYKNAVSIENIALEFKNQFV